MRANPLAFPSVDTGGLIARSPAERFVLAQGKASPPQKARASDTAQRQGRVHATGRAAIVDPDSAEAGDGDLGGFFVDAAPSGRVERPAVEARGDKKTARAAERRREQGRAPSPVEPRDTRTSLKQGGHDERGATGPHRDDRVGTGQRKNGAHRGHDARGEGSSGLAAAPTGVVAADRIDGVRATLSCIKGPEAGQVLSLTTGTYTVGRARENHLVLKDIAASRKHLQIDIDGTGARLTDLGSGNGTRVNGKRATAVELRHGDTIEIGSSLLVFAETGKDAPADDPARDEAQARVVAAADELARELSEKMRFGEPGFDDGFVAKTRALKTADARAIADQIEREKQQKQAPSKKPNDRLWNETFTNLPLSAVVPGDQPLQGGTAPRPERPRTKPRVPAFPIPQRPMGPTGTGVEDSVVEDPLAEDPSRAGRPSTLASVLVSAGVVVIVGALALGVWAIFFKDDQDDARAKDAASLVAREKEAEYATAIARMQDAYGRGDWIAVRDYAVAALQVRPDDAMARGYKRDAELKLTTPAPLPSAPSTSAPSPSAPSPSSPSAPSPPAATAAAPPPAPPTPPPTTTSTTPAVTAAPVPPEPAAPPPRVEPPKPKPRPKPAPTPTKPRRAGMSDEEAQAQFERAIDAFRAKDNETACAVLDKIADRAPSGSVWKGKAESLYLKKCGD